MANSEIKMSMSLATAGVTGALSKAKAGVADFSERSMEKLKSVAAFFKTGLIVGAGFLVGMKKSIDRMTEMSRAADRLGVSTEMFQKLSHAAAQTGIDTERLADAMKDLDVKLTDGINRGGSFAELIQELGLNMEDLAKMPAAERFLTFSDAIKNASGSLSRFGADEFGDAMYELLPLLELGSEGILELGSSATIATDEQIKAAARASAVIEKMSSQFSGTIGIAVSELYQLFEVVVASATQAVIEIGNSFGNLGDIIKAAIRLDWDGVKAGFNKMAADGEGAWGRVGDAANSVIDEQLAAGKKVDAESSAMTAAEIARLKKSGDQRKKNADDWQKAIEKSASLEQKAADERESRELKSMSTQDKIIATQDKILKLRKEISAIDPFTDKGQVERAEKELEVEKLITDQAELQGDLGDEAAAADEAAIEAKLNKLDLELQIAKASGDPNRIAAAQKELDTETQIVALMNQHKIGREEATKILGNQNAHLQTQKDLELQLLMAQANGNDALARELQGRIDKEKEALDIMEKFGISIEKARVIAAKLAGINAGPDVNNSGFVTRKEQRAFDKKQKALAKEEKKRNRAEEAAERNVSAEKRRGTGLDAKKARDKELQEQRDIKKAGEQALKDWKEQGDDAPKMFDLDGNPIGPDGKPIKGGGGDPNAPGNGGGGGGADPNAPGNGGGGGPAEPKKPANAVVDGLKPTLEDIKGELIKIEKHLQC